MIDQGGALFTLFYIALKKNGLTNYRRLRSEIKCQKYHCDVSCKKKERLDQCHRHSNAPNVIVTVLLGIAEVRFRTMRTKFPKFKYKNQSEKANINVCILRAREKIPLAYILVCIQFTCFLFLARATARLSTGTAVCRR